MGFHRYNTRSQRNGKNKVDDYPTVKFLGSGGFSKVWLSKCVSTNSKVALKIVDLLALNNEFIELCMNEVRLLQKVDNINVVKCIDAFKHETSIYIVLEYVDGGDLCRVFQKMADKGKWMCEKRIWFYFYQICNGIQDLHSKKILHRDIKPENILITSKDVVKISDLGLSLPLKAKQHNPKISFGTEYYNAPEKTAGIEGYGFKSDVFSLGCVLYEMCFYQSPYAGEGENSYEIYTKIEDGDKVPFLTDLYSKQLIHVYDACTALNPDDRPDSSDLYKVSQIMYEKFVELEKKYTANEDLPQAPPAKRGRRARK